MANITSQNEVTVSGLAKVVEGIKTWVESSAAAHSAYRVHNLQEWGDVSGRPDSGNYVFAAEYVNGELDVIKASIDEAASATSADMEVIAAALNDLDDRINATSGKADKVTGATAGHLAALDADGNLTDAGVTSGSFKTKQNTYTATSGTLATVTSINQNENGEISVTFQDIQSATDSVKGVVQLATSIGTPETENNRAATERAVREAIDAAVSNAYHHAGTMDASNIDNSLLNSDNEGNVYNVTASGYTTNDFLEGAGKIIRVGDNVGICLNGGSYKFDLLSGFVDLSGYKTKQTAITSAASNALQTVQQIQQDANGELTITYQKIQSATTSQEGVVQLAGSISATVSSENNKAATEKAVRDAINALDVSNITANLGVSKTITALSETDGMIAATASDIQIEESQVTNLTIDLGKKADKVTGATADNFAGLDANGNLQDSGKKAADFATSAQGAKADTAVQSITTNGTTWTKTGTTVEIPLATSAAGGSAGIMSGPDKVKLDAISASAEVNQNAFSYVTAGGVTIEAESKKDTLNIVTSGNVNVSANASTDTILIGIPLMDETDVNNILNLLN